MNWFSLACRNIRKSLRDYTVYFLTLIFGVVIFYVFNSVNDQSVIKTMSDSSYQMIQLLVVLLEFISIIVAFVLGFLIIYANNFLIKRRKKEFGIYFLLGMEKKEVSKILVAETVIVGLISLAVGIGIGVFVSQFMSILVGKLFEADMSAYVFVVSGGAILKTIINFVVIYVIVLFFHAGNLSRLKLIDLLSDSKKAEKQTMKNPVVGTLVFLVAVLALGIAYYRVGFQGNQVGGRELLVYIVTGIVSTVLIFWAIAGFVMMLLQKIKGFYFKGLNSFVIRQFCNSVNSSVVSMAVICLMLFVTICTFASGFSAAHEFQERMRIKTPVDFSIEYAEQESVTECLAREGMPIEQWSEDYREFPVYQCGTINIGSSLGSLLDAAKEQFPVARWETPEDILRISDYNALAEMYGMPTYELAEDEYLVVCDFLMFQELRNLNLAKGGTQKLGQVELCPALEECVEGYMVMSGGNYNLGFLVVPDSAVEQAKESVYKAGHLLVGNYLAGSKEERKEIDYRLQEITAKYTAWRYMNENPIPPMTMGTKVAIRESNNGLTMIVAFVVIYMGVVFLLASAALLALKALTESIDGAGRFKMLKQIGCENKVLRKCLFSQIAVYFLFPLGVAIVHSVFGIRYIHTLMISFIGKGTTWGLAVTAVVLTVLYGAYLLATFKSSKKIIELE